MVMSENIHRKNDMSCRPEPDLSSLIQRGRGGMFNFVQIFLKPILHRLPPIPYFHLHSGLNKNLLELPLSISKLESRQRDITLFCIFTQVFCALEVARFLATSVPVIFTAIFIICLINIVIIIQIIVAMIIVVTITKVNSTGSYHVDSKMSAQLTNHHHQMITDQIRNSQLSHERSSVWCRGFELLMAS